jgi:GYF domain 2
MTDTWHYNINGKEYGPVSFETLVEKVKKGVLNPGIAITADNSDEITKAGKVPGLFAQSEIIPVATVEKWFCWIGSKEYGPVSTIQLEGWIREKRVSPDDFIRPGRTKEWFFAGTYKDLFEDAGIAGAADALIRQLHPELFAKKIKEGLTEDSPIDEFNHHGDDQMIAEQMQSAVAEKVETVQKTPKRKVHNHKSLTEILMIIPRFLMDLAWAVTDKLARLFPQTKTAWAILLGSIAAIAITIFVILPPFFKPHFENEECLVIYDDILTQIDKMKAEEASPEAWTQLQAREIPRLEEVIENLEETAGVTDRHRQQILWAGRECLLKILKDPKDSSPSLRADYERGLEYGKYRAGQIKRTRDN